ncbi:hypothetical protein [Aggregatibacter sp. Marseille-P9115]|uniref:AbiTii domain-containing protein n=1 Tax=Aggregatibacter sp. Marseille-P9115 TaxID=2866570 RepID=UPI001E5B5C2E|nr:hypothetical protein [Aggregatibacter sp. Marseille-P9115]
MTLLQEIINGCVNHSLSLNETLMKCKILAYRLKNEELKNWVNREINGYDNKDSFPSYRIIPAHSKGDFQFSAHLVKNLNIPSTAIREEFREYVDICYMSRGVSTLEHLLNNSTSDMLMADWDHNLVVLEGRKIYKDATCLYAWQEIPLSAITEILEKVRSIILDFCLKIEQEYPNIGEHPMINTPDIKKVEQIVQNTFNFYGGTQNVATNSKEFSQDIQLNSNELFNNIENAINSISSIDEMLKSELLKLLLQMKDSNNKQTFSEKYKNFIELISNHASILTTLAPFIPALTNLLGH